MKFTVSFVSCWVLLLVLCLTGWSEGAASDKHHDWGYGKRNGPNHWQGMCSTGSFQSPIDLSLFTAHPRHFEPLVFFGYNVPSNATITNNGHTVTLTMQQPCAAQIAGGGLPGPYTLAQVHFHWGSEHTIDEVRFPLEAHFVHYDSRRFKSVKEAVGLEDGLAVLGVLYRETNEPNPVVARILAGVSGVVHAGSEMMLPSGGLQLEQLLPRDTETFYRYRGSLTTPGCNEGVLWTVLVTQPHISKDQVAMFRELKSLSGKLEINYRPVQPLNERMLYVRTASAAPTIVASWYGALLGLYTLLIVVH